MQKANSNSSDGTAADSEQKVEDTNVSQHSRKPDVVGSQSHGILSPSLSDTFFKTGVLNWQITEPLPAGVHPSLISSFTWLVNSAGVCAITILYSVILSIK